MPVAANGGVCCECNALSGCDCMNSVPCSLGCRTKSGFATLCGYAEFTDISDPPKAYRKSATSGGLAFQAYEEAGCITRKPANDFACTWFGECSYNKDTCALTEGGRQECGGAPVVSCGVLGAGAGAIETATSTTKSMTSVGCFFQGFVWGIYSTVSGNVLLSDEDTEPDAIARALAAITDWTSCLCNTDVCTAWVQDRTGTGSTTFGYRAIQTKVQWTGIAGRSYDVTVNFGRRVLGTGGPFLDLGLQYEVTVLAGVSGVVGTEWIDVPSEAGYETVASSCQVLLQPA